MVTERDLEAINRAVLDGYEVRLWMTAYKDVNIVEENRKA